MAVAIRTCFTTRTDEVAKRLPKKGGLPVVPARVVLFAYLLLGLVGLGYLGGWVRCATGSFSKSARLQKC